MRRSPQDQPAENFIEGRLRGFAHAAVDRRHLDDRAARRGQPLKALAPRQPGDGPGVRDRSQEAVARADSLLAPLGRKLPAAEAESLQRKFQDEDDAASAGMVLFFTE